MSDDVALPDRGEYPEPNKQDYIHINTQQGREVMLELKSGLSEGNQESQIMVRIVQIMRGTEENKSPRPSEIRGFLEGKSNKTARELLDESREMDMERESHLLEDK